MVKGIESVVVSECNVSIVVDEERQHIVPLFRDSIMERSVPLRILNTHINQNPIKCLVHYKLRVALPLRERKHVTTLVIIIGAGSGHSWLSFRINLQDGE